MSSDVARQLGNALLLACAGESERIDIVFSVDEGKPNGEQTKKGQDTVKT